MKAILDALDRLEAEIEVQLGEQEMNIRGLHADIRHLREELVACAAPPASF